MYYVTLFSVAQGLIAKAGAIFTSLFLGRLDNIGAPESNQLRDFSDNYGLQAEIIAASIRSLRHVESIAKVCANTALIPGS
ncbi:beta/alpha barrel domain-containing protein [Bacillus haynesii]|uniref:hypothetical protein n=1 Tax=Bacillus haynesii TaxID=1925021 RepID=UPI002DB69FF8|nr:hypothetical protein [Bacillus haynesii]MEC1559731.1 hypothetical protein [Bacillus haynesii]